MPEWNTTHANLVDAEFWVQPAATVDAEIARLFAEAPLDFFEELMPDDSPLAAGPGYWAVIRHEDIATVSRDTETYSSADGITVTNSPPEFVEFFSSMIAMDDPRHARLRRIVSKGFTPRMLGQLEDSVQAEASKIVADIASKGECDFVVDVAAKLPLKIVCDLMGVPQDDYQAVFDATNIILGISDPEFQTEGIDFVTALLTAGGDLAAIMTRVVEDKRGGDGIDLTSVIVNTELEDDQLSAEDLASFFILLVVAGNETTRNAISWGLKFLTDNPEQRALWASDFEAHAPAAIEEIVRLASPVTYMRRTVTQDTVLSGQELKAGDKVCMFYLAANRDETVFERPLEFDITREPNPQYGFGGPGAHFCLGAHLARREMLVIFRELFRTLPDIKAAEEPDLLQSSFIHGVKHMKVEFTPVG